MPREVQLNQNIEAFTSKPTPAFNLVESFTLSLDDSEEEPFVPSRKSGLSQQQTPRYIGVNRKKAEPAKPKFTDLEVIYLSSDSEDDSRKNVSSSNVKPTAIRALELIKPQPSQSPPKPSGAQSPTKKRPATVRKYVVISSSEDEDDTMPPSKPTRIDSLSESDSSKPQSSSRFIGADTTLRDDGVIEYIPSLRKPSRLSPIKKSAPSSSPSKSERRRTLLEPDPPSPPPDEGYWEITQDDSKSGAMFVKPFDLAYDDSSSHLVGHDHSQEQDLGTPMGATLPREEDVTVQAPSSPSKTPRRKKMPEAVATLHRIAIPYLKRLDSRVFGNRLGASHLPDIDQVVSPIKKGKGRNQEGVIWGMGSRGEFGDEHGSFIELVWSNRMATTAGRTEYKKASNGQIMIKIELGVKVVTSEERLRNTLAHEACHAASWAIDGDFTQPHGKTFKGWARKVMRTFPEVEVTTKHDYEIEFKFIWKCIKPTCGQTYKRHSNSINIEEQGCFCGSRLQPQFTPKATRPKKTTATSSKSISSDITSLPGEGLDPTDAILYKEERVLSNDRHAVVSDANVDDLAITLQRATIDV
ncbi:hypothetical protein CPB86DRAFT_780569 [Serendipita vermifera]|nr:hypothetical protein CPB86DRAFT_780569 [Serendipita vermifera]